MVYSGSANMSRASQYGNDENLLEIRGSRRIAGIYLAEFMRLYEHYRARALFIRRKQEGSMATFRLDDTSRWMAVGASHLRDSRLEDKRKVILHYDFLRPYRRSTVTHRRDEALDVLGSAQNITVVTRVVGPDRLRQQLYDSELAGVRTRRSRDLTWLAASVRSPRRIGRRLLRLFRNGKAVSQSSRPTHLHAMYGRPGWLKSQYERWFNHCDDLRKKLPIKATVVVSRLQDGETIITESWQEAMREYPSS